MKLLRMHRAILPIDRAIARGRSASDDCNPLHRLGPFLGLGVAVGELVWGDRAHVSPITVVNAEPPWLFAFRWCCTDGDVDGSANSLLVTFGLTPSGTGTRCQRFLKIDPARVW